MQVLGGMCMVHVAQLWNTFPSTPVSQHLTTWDENGLESTSVVHASTFEPPPPNTHTPLPPHLYYISYLTHLSGLVCTLQHLRPGTPGSLADL